MKALWYIPAIILGLLSLFSFIGIFNRKIFVNKNKPNEKPITRKQAVIAWLVFGFLGLVCLSLSSPSDKPKDAAPLAVPISSTASPEKVEATPAAKADSAKAKAEAKAKKEADAKAKATEAAKKKDPVTLSKEAAAKRFDSVEVSFDKKTGHVFITAAGKDNFTTKMIKEGMWMDATDTLQDIKDVAAIKDVAFNITFPMTDKFGNSSQDTVMRIQLSDATRHKINWENFTFSNLPDIADSYWEHPALSK